MKIFTARIRKFRGKPTLEILGKTKESNGSFFVCYRETLDGKKSCRNLFFHYIAGYYCEGYPAKKMDDCILDNTPNITNCNRPLLEEEIQLLSEFDTNFKYIAHKTQINILEAFKMYHLRIKHPEMEILLNMGFRNLATNKTFLKLTKPKQKELIHYYLDYEKKLGTSTEERKYALLIDIKGAMKNKIAPKAYNYFRCDAKYTKLDLKTICLLTDKNINIQDYYHYINNLKEYFPERTNDRYWTTFKTVLDFHEKENRVNTQVENIRDFSDLKKLKKMQKKYTTAIKKAQWQCEYNGLTVYIPKNMEDIMNQAKKLKQCLVTGDYPKKVIEKQIYLIFIKKGNNPLATAELIRKTNTIGQFYGNELDRHNCQPTQECKEALNMFMDKFIRKSA